MIRELATYDLAELLVLGKRIVLVEPVGGQDKARIVVFRERGIERCFHLDVGPLQCVYYLSARTHVHIYQYCMIHGSTPFVSSDTAFSIASAVER